MFETRPFLHSSTKEHVDTLHNVILFRIVRVFLGGDFQDGRNGCVVVLEDMPDAVGNVLIDQNDPNIITGRQVLKCFFYLWKLRVLFDNQKVGPLGRPMSDSC